MTSTTETQIDQALAKKIRGIREYHGMSRPVFAKTLNIPPTTLKNWELGYRDASGKIVLLICNHPIYRQHSSYLVDMRIPAESLVPGGQQ